MHEIVIERIYDKARQEDGFRVLVDRIWPRGVSKKEAAIDRWAKHLAPSTELRKWFNHDRAKWQDFVERYRRELAALETELADLIEQCGDRRMTLLFGARDETHNQAVVLRDVLAAM